MSAWRCRGHYWRLFLCLICAAPMYHGAAALPWAEDSSPAAAASMAPMAVGSPAAAVGMAPMGITVSPPPSFSARDPDNAFRVESSGALNGQLVIEILLTGNQVTRDATILRELFLQPGDPYDAKLLARDLKFLEGLGIFASVNVVPRLSPGGVILVYHFVERGEVRYGLFYPFCDYRDKQVRAGAVYRHRNLFGGRESFKLKVAGGWEERLELNLFRPWLRNLPIGHRLSYLFLDREKDDPFRLHRLAIGFWVSLRQARPLDHRFVFQASWGNRHLHVDEEQRLEKVNSLTLGYSRDTRNSFLNPNQGGFFSLLGTIYDPLLGSSVILKQSGVRWGHYWRLPLSWTGVLAMNSNRQWGELFHRGVYSLGGLDSIRGYASGEISGWIEPDSLDLAVGQPGRNQMTLHGELRRNLLPRFTLDLPILGIVDVQGEGVLFVDAGFLWGDDDAIVPREVQESVYSFGTGLRIYTPIGDVLRLELGLTEAGCFRFHLGSGLNY